MIICLAIFRFMMQEFMMTNKWVRLFHQEKPQLQQLDTEATGTSATVAATSNVEENRNEAIVIGTIKI